MRQPTRRSHCMFKEAAHRSPAHLQLSIPEAPLSRPSSHRHRVHLKVAPPSATTIMPSPPLAPYLHRLKPRKQTLHRLNSKNKPSIDRIRSLASLFKAVLGDWRRRCIHVVILHRPAKANPSRTWPLLYQTAPVEVVLDSYLAATLRRRQDQWLAEASGRHRTRKDFEIGNPRILVLIIDWVFVFLKLRYKQNPLYLTIIWIRLIWLYASIF